ncbi:uncharacterized protein LOC110178504 isoform X2 [Drosophila serrata]|uniref:uncharacterized protein LOC110178504 isoform X2 n=1 Tax=Drosophila serrata TaxID=7274 RepID=UPI000A1D2F6E|nr:uncharacterized protein LOC110178504 isoform X2 [Drosophila serrata]
MLPVWTPIFLFSLMILSSVWVMLNIEALEGIFGHHESVAKSHCPVELNAAVREFLSWPNEPVNQDQTVPEKEVQPEKVIDQEDLEKNKVEVPLNFQSLELQPVIEAKVEKVLEPIKESKVQENAKERIRRAPLQKLQGNVKDRKTRLVKPHLVNYRKENANKETNQFMENV